ncbi:MAG: patatin-like phospholipase family protein [Gammaproteobacteria bacterium]|nr:patatin-like phospholipase family protein [Gammaproteobacteria bacterium]
MGNRKKTVSLVLGSGGARGLTHIGIIHWLEEHNYEIKTISGSSIGALVGGIYGAGKLDTFEGWLRALQKRDVLKLLDFAYSMSGLFSGDKIMQTLEKLLGDINIEDLPIKFTAVACDLDTEKEVWFDKGSLFEAIRASISIPTIFTPVSYHGRLLVDGAVLNPVPVAPTLSQLTDITIAVSLSGKRELINEKKHTDSPRQVENKYLADISNYIDKLQKKYRPQQIKQADVFDVMLKTYESMQNTISRFKVAGYNPDHLLEVPCNACKILEFYRASEMIDYGYALAEKNLSRYL